MAGLNVGGMFDKLISWAGGLWVTIVVMLIAVLILWGGLWFRRKRKLNKPVIEMYDLGNGVFDFVITKGGWFSQHLTLRGLWDYGKEQLFRLKDRTPVYDVSHNDYRRINGVNGIVVARNPNDPKFAIPISKFWLGGVQQVTDSKTGKIIQMPTRQGATEALAQIAPVDLRNAAQQSLDEVGVEMKTAMERWMPLITMGTIALVILLSVIFMTQYGNHMVDKATELLIRIHGGGVEATNAAVTAASNAP